jgi:hypothetical protein
MENKVFISKGSAATRKQIEYIDAVLNTLRLVGLNPRIMNENEWSYSQPLKAIKKIIRECDGIVVIAFTRTRYDKGIEIRRDDNKELSNISLPTPWNHIEAAIAYAFGLPVLVIAENSLKSEGLIESGYDWQVYWSNWSPADVKSESFKGFLNSWRIDVIEYAKTKASVEGKPIVIEPDKLTIGTIFKCMSISQLWGLLGALASIISGVAIAAYKLGGGKWPWQ